MPRYESAPELVVIARPDAGLRVRSGERGTVTSVAGAAVEPLANLLRGEVTITPLFGRGEERLIARAAHVMAETGVAVPDLSIFYKVEAPTERLNNLAQQFREQET